MNKLKTYSKFAQLFMLGLLLMVGALWTGRADAATPHQLACNPTMEVDSEADLNDAINCYNTLPAGELTINIAADITLTAELTPFDRGTNIASLNINGNNHTIDGDEKGRILTFLDAQAIVDGLTMQNGASTSVNPAGGVFVGIDGVIILRNSSVSNNSAEAESGGIYNFGVLIIDNSTVSNNSTNAGGGGLMNRGTATVTNGSTIANNMAMAEGGGIFNVGTLKVDNSTVSNNSANVDGGGLINQGTATITNGSTIANNTSARYGGGTVSYTHLTLPTKA